jgi:hypothetical protein
MKKLNQFAVAALAAAGLLTGATHAQAQSATISSNSPDLLMAFRVADDTTGPGGNTNLELDLGYTAASLLAKAGGVGGVVTLGGTGFQQDLSASDLSTAFGSNWASLTSGGGEVKWSVFGANLNTNEFWVTNTATFARSTNSTQNGIVSEISGVYSDLSQSVSTANSNEDYIVTNASGDGGSYYNAITNNQSGDNWEYSFGPSETVVGNNSPVGLYDSPVGSGNAYEVGAFALANNGALTFTALIPEPSTWVSIVIGAFGLLAFRRRRLA